MGMMAAAATPPLSNAGDPLRAGWGRIAGDTRRARLHTLELAASDLPSPCEKLAFRLDRELGFGSALIT
jgi:hypothetical protein